MPRTIGLKFDSDKQTRECITKEILVGLRRLRIKKAIGSLVHNWLKKQPEGVKKQEIMPKILGLKIEYSKYIRKRQTPKKNGPKMDTKKRTIGGNGDKRVFFVLIQIAVNSWGPNNE